MTHEAVVLSVIIPVYNEAPNLVELYQGLKEVLDPLGKPYEIIFVDDGSTDDGPKILEEMASSDNRVRLIQFARNFGQTAAISAGFDNARGEIYITLDADNQNDPADIPMLLKKLDEGYGIVCGWRRERRDPLITRKVPSMMANKLISWLTGVRLNDYGCTLKAYKADYVKSIRLYGEMHRFIPAYAAMAGARVAEVQVRHHERKKGRTKYGLSRTFKVILDLITVKFLYSFSTKPIYLFGGLGLILCFLAVFSGAEVLVEKFTIGTYAHKNPFLLVAVFLFTIGVICMLMGLIAELLVRTYHEAQGKKTYVLRGRSSISNTLKLNDF